MNKFILLFLMVFSSLVVLGNIKILHGPYLQNLGMNEVTIVWISDKPSIGWVELAPDDNTHFYAKERTRIFDTKIGIKNVSKIHAVKLKNLDSATRYRYRVCVQEVLEHIGNKVIYGSIAYADMNTQAPNSFVTSDTLKADFSFAMVNDIHGNNEILENLINQCDFRNTDLILFNGDMVSIANSEEDLFKGFMDKSVEIFASSIPMYYCRGNHETRGPMAPYIQQYFNPKENELYYVFRYGSVCFIVLDCGEDKPDSANEYYGITNYDEYRTQQAEWLDKVLQSDLYKSAKFKVVVCHMPPFGTWHGELDIEKKFLPLLNKAVPDVYLAAHLHKTIYNKAGTNGVKFPVLVNSNKTILKVFVKKNSMDICIYDLKGKEVEHLQIKK